MNSASCLDFISARGVDAIFGRTPRGPIPKTLSGKIRHAVAKEMFGKVSSQ